MNEIAALLEAVRDATGAEAAVWERQAGGHPPRLLGASSPWMAERTVLGPVAWDVGSWARANGLRARLVTIGERVGWLFLPADAAGEVDLLLPRLLPLVRRLVDERERQGREVARVQAEAARQQLAREMKLAHDLQLKLLPSPGVVAPEARAATRMVPAESVGGDFFLLARLDADRTGVLIGDVAGHGYPAALVMALALSAAAIHMQAAFDPALALESVRASLADELTSTEMALTLCYAVIDGRARELRFANAGHPHAFRLGADGRLVRLTAVVPPLGFSDLPIEESVTPWRRGDRLVLFTDGLPDLRNAAGGALGERAVRERLAGMVHGESPEQILEALAEQARAHRGETPLRDDVAVVIVDRPEG
ncbi:MAG: PP2C family protein-serine/threonine phosphatase [Gemmatimonadetes bacterium]|nr:PP2C family protein-serine/threonine phosphatase [Gemmatimonadota bacterium]